MIEKVHTWKFFLGKSIIYIPWGRGSQRRTREAWLVQDEARWCESWMNKSCLRAIMGYLKYLGQNTPKIMNYTQYKLYIDVMKNFKMALPLRSQFFFRHPELMGGSLVEITTQGLWTPAGVAERWRKRKMGGALILASWRNRGWQFVMGKQWDHLSPLLQYYL